MWYWIAIVERNANEICMSYEKLKQRAFPNENSSQGTQGYLKHIQEFRGSLARYLTFACVSKGGLSRENKLLCQIGSFYTS